MSTPLSVFVYGTLKPGGFYYHQYCEGFVVASYPAIALGQLYDLPLGYPAMTMGNNLVRGDVLVFDDVAVLKDLDKLEGYDPERSPDQNEYERVWIEVFDDAKQFSLGNNLRSVGFAWSYIMTQEQVKGLGGMLLTSGIWIDLKRQS